MSDGQEWVAAGVLVAFVGVLIALVTLLTARRKDRDTQVLGLAQINTKIDILGNTVAAMDKSVTAALGGIEARQALTDGKIETHADRLARVEESTKSAHRRIDEHLKGGHEQ